MLDLLIRGATVYDGTRRPGRVADGGVSQEKVTEVGNIKEKAKTGVHGVWVNGVQVFDGRGYAGLKSGPGRVLRDCAR